MDVEIADNISKLMLEERPPLNIVTMGIDYDQSLKASLEFEYDGVVVPYSKTTAEKAPYITIKSRAKIWFTGLKEILSMNRKLMQCF